MRNCWPLLNLYWRTAAWTLAGRRSLTWASCGNGDGPSLSRTQHGVPGCTDAIRYRFWKCCGIPRFGSGPAGECAARLRRAVRLVRREHLVRRHQHDFAVARNRQRDASAAVVFDGIADGALSAISARITSGRSSTFGGSSSIGGAILPSHGETHRFDHLQPAQFLKRNYTRRIRFVLEKNQGIHHGTIRLP